MQEPGTERKFILSGHRLAGRAKNFVPSPPQGIQHTGYFSEAKKTNATTKLFIQFYYTFSVYFSANVEVTKSLACNMYKWLREEV